MSTTDNPQENNTTDIVAQEKIKKSLLWFGIFSIIMLFAGITSGYFVARKSSFWVDLQLPAYFLWSTITVIISSGLLYLAAVQIKNNKTGIAKGLIGLSFIFGTIFGITQYKGFLEMSEKGSALNARITNLQGRYGEYFTLFKNDKEITFDGDAFFYQGQALTEAELNEVKDFLGQFMNVRVEEVGKIKDYGKYTLEYRGRPVTYLNNRLEFENLSLSPEQKSRLFFFSEAIISGRGDFYMIGKYGEDFTVNFKGEPLTYANRKFYRNGQEISALVYSELNQSDNRTSQFIIAFVVVHGLHWIAGVIVLLVLLISALKNKYTSVNYTGLKVGSIYWHFLGILWLYLYVFLNFIH